MCDFVATDSVANGFGKSGIVIFRNKPGFTLVEATKAAEPVKTLFVSPVEEPKTTAASPARTAGSATPGR
jgi:hypothetical protein